ncbi:MAG: endoribonuclease L-PSP, partial [Armatimonadetes bacterium]|nr:endoribonuclease L-PSP [Armatimonadota bacterium]
MSWPVTWSADAFAAEAVSQVQVHAVAGPVVRSVRLDGRVVGRLYEHEHVRCAVFGDLQPRDRRAPPAKQAQQGFETLEAALAEAGLALSQVVRLWLHVDHILDWYDELNAVRNGFFASRGLFDQLLPASTAVGAANHAGTALCIGAWAMSIPADVGSAAEVPSPLQGSPREYGAALSRAVELTLPGCRRLLISGTNSIGRDGTSVRGKHAGEQAERTLDVLGALLESRGMSFAQTVRAGIYVRDE